MCVVTVSLVCVLSKAFEATRTTVVLNPTVLVAHSRHLAPQHVNMWLYPSAAAAKVMAP